MLPWIFKRSLKRVPWGMVLTVSIWLVEKGRERIERNLTHKERREFLSLIGKSKGRPSSLSQRDRTRIKNIAGKAIRG